MLMSASNQTDIYRLPFGFRTVQTDNKNFYINKKPFYFKGFGMHEDSNVSLICYDNILCALSYTIHIEMCVEINQHQQWIISIT